jgi:TorA maturation chaperone TorD
MGWELMKQASLKFDLEAVHDEYFSLFLGVGRGELVPFGSWYITGFLMEKPVAVLRSELIRLGIERQEGVVESEDHIAALCDAMALIIRSSEEISLETQQQFFNDHLAPWVGRFFNDMQNAKAAHFYRSVGFFGESFIEFEQQLLDMQS